MIESLKSLVVGNIVLQENKEDEIKCDYFILDYNEKKIAFGWQFENKFTDETYDFYNKIKLIRNGQFDTLKEYLPGSSYYFALNAKYFWFLDPLSMLPMGKRQDSPEIFIRKLKANFPHIKTVLEKENDDIQLLKYENLDLRESKDSLKKEQEFLLKKTKKLEKENETLKEENISYKERIKFLVEKDLKNEKLIGAVIIEKLTPEQLDAIKSTKGTDKQINFDFEFPSVVLKTYIEHFLPEQKFKGYLNSDELARSNDDGVPEWAIFSKVKPKFNLHFTYIIINPKGDHEIVYNGTPEKVELESPNKLNFKTLQRKQEILSLDYYLIEL